MNDPLMTLPYDRPLPGEERTEDPDASRARHVEYQRRTLFGAIANDDLATVGQLASLAGDEPGGENRCRRYIRALADGRLRAAFDPHRIRGGGTRRNLRYVQVWRDDFADFLRREADASELESLAAQWAGIHPGA